MAAEFKDITWTLTGTTTSTAFATDMPAAVVAGDLLVAFVSAEPNGTVAGWDAGVSDSGLPGIWSKEADGTEDGTTVSFPVTGGAGQSLIGVVVRYSIDAVSALDSARTNTSGTAPRDIDFPLELFTDAAGSTITASFIQGGTPTSFAASDEGTFRGGEDRGTIGMIVADKLNHDSAEGTITHTYDGFSGSQTLRGTFTLWEHDPAGAGEGPSFERAKHVKIGEMPYRLHTGMRGLRVEA